MEKKFFPVVKSKKKFSRCPRSRQSPPLIFAIQKKFSKKFFEWDSIVKNFFENFLIPKTLRIVFSLMDRSRNPAITPSCTTRRALFNELSLMKFERAIATKRLIYKLLKNSIAAISLLVSQ